MPSLLGYLAQKGELPPRLVIALAGFIRLYRGDLITLNDDREVVAWFERAWQTADSNEALARTVLSNSNLWDRDLTEAPQLVERVGAALDTMDTGELLELLGRAGR